MTRADQWLQHVALNTGITKRTYRDEVSDESVAGAMDLLERAKHERVPMHALGRDVAITVTSGGPSAMIATIWEGQRPVVTMGVARTSLPSARLWRILLRSTSPLTPIVLDESSRPQPPWIAARIEIGGALVSPTLMMAIGGLEAAIGFAFLEMR